MGITENITERLSAIVAGKLPDEAQQRMAALFAVRGIMPDADAMDRLLLANYIVTGYDGIPGPPEREMVEVKNMAGETVLAYPSQPTYPYQSGDTEVLGPEIFASTDAPAADTVICWMGQNFVPQQSEEIAPGLPPLRTEPAPTSGEGWQGRRG